MTTFEKVDNTRSRRAMVFNVIMRTVHVITLVAGYGAFAASFIPYKGGHPSDEWFGVALFASTGFTLGIIALLCSIVPLRKNWWSRRWLYVTVALIVICFLRVAIVTYTY